MDEENAALATATTNFVLTGIDNQTAAPFLTCTDATSTTQVNSGTLAVGSTTYTGSSTAPSRRTASPRPRPTRTRARRP